MNGQMLKEQGMQLAMDFSGEGWKERALELFREFCLELKAAGREYVRVEEFRAVAPPPRTPKAWGAFSRAAMADGIIAPTGQYEKAESAKTHAHPVLRWRIVL
jgi:hypothetical protein